MGTLKKHIARDVIYPAFISGTGTNISLGQTLKSYSGTDYTTIKDTARSYFLNNQYYSFYASAQELSSYSYNEQDISSIKLSDISVGMTKTSQNDGKRLALTLTLHNNGSDSITVNSIKTIIGAGGSTSGLFLFYTYYLSTPVTIPAGESAIVNLIFDYSQPAAT
jgi:hypothetical protein